MLMAGKSRGHREASEGRRVVVSRVCGVPVAYSRCGCSSKWSFERALFSLMCLAIISPPIFTQPTRASRSQPRSSLRDAWMQHSVSLLCVAEFLQFLPLSRRAASSAHASSMYHRWNIPFRERPSRWTESDMHVHRADAAEEQRSGRTSQKSTTCSLPATRPPGRDET